MAPPRKLTDEEVKNNRRRTYADGTKRRRRTDDEKAVLRRAKQELREELKAKGFTIVRKGEIVAQRENAAKNTIARRGQKLCKGFNLVGEECKNRALKKGLDIEGQVTTGDFCLRHEDSIGSSTWRRFRQDGNEVIPLPRQVSPTELAAAAFERAPYYLLKPYLRTLGYDMDKETGELSELEGGGAKIVGFSREGVARVSKHDNLELQVRVAEKLADRFYGKPRTAVTLDGIANGAVIVTMPNDPEHYNSVARVLIETGAVPPVNGNGNGDYPVDPPAIEGTAVDDETLDQ